jgi:hypothetical protein
MPRGSAVDRPQEADRHLGPDKGSRRRSAGNDEARSERGSGRRWRIWYRIPDAQGTVSCVSAVFAEYIQERHETQETGSIRVQKRVQCRRCGMAWDEVRDAAPSAVESITLSSCAPEAARGRSGRSQGSIGDPVVLADVRQRPRHNRAGGIYHLLASGRPGAIRARKCPRKLTRDGSCLASTTTTRDQVSPACESRGPTHSPYLDCNTDRPGWRRRTSEPGDPLVAA